MNAKKSLSILLMLGLLTPLTACGEAKESAEGEPQVTQPPAVESPTPAAESPTPTVPSASPQDDEGGEGGEGT